MNGLTDAVFGLIRRLSPRVIAGCTEERYIYSNSNQVMIISFRDPWLESFFVEDVRSKRIPSGLDQILFRKIQMIDDSRTDQDLRIPPSNHFEKLQGNLSGFHSIRVNRQWRLVFHWNGSSDEASELYLDNHSYR